MYGLKCGPAEPQPFLKSPFSCTWNPCNPGLNPVIVPVTLTPSGCCSNIRIPRGPSTGEPSSPKAFNSTTAFRPTACTAQDYISSFRKRHAANIFSENKRKLVRSYLIEIRPNSGGCRISTHSETCRIFMYAESRWTFWKLSGWRVSLPPFERMIIGSAGDP